MLTFCLPFWYFWVRFSLFSENGDRLGILLKIQFYSLTAFVQLYESPAFFFLKKNKTPCVRLDILKASLKFHLGSRDTAGHRCPGVREMENIHFLSFPLWRETEGVMQGERGA